MIRERSLEEPQLTDEQERELEERFRIKEKMENYEKFVEAVKEVVEETEGNPYGKLDTIRFYIKELEDV